MPFLQESTAKDIDKVIREEGIVDTGVTRAMLYSGSRAALPLTPCHIYSAIKVQRALVRKRRNDKFKALGTMAKASSIRGSMIMAGSSDEAATPARADEIGVFQQRTLQICQHECAHVHRVLMNDVSDGSHVCPGDGQGLRRRTSAMPVADASNMQDNRAQVRV